MPSLLTFLIRMLYLLAMSLLLDSYRRNAEAARIEAQRANLANVRKRAADAADIWLALADRLEWVEQQQRARDRP
jgi:hypothetical protein